MDCKTQPDFFVSLGDSFEDRRAQSRYLCPHRPLIELVVWPHFGSVWAKVYDISQEGIGLICHKVIDAGSKLVFRVEPHYKALRARVVHVTRIHGDAWHIGCTFAQPLTTEELAAYLPPPVNA
jgi:hypothetical protein